MPWLPAARDGRAGGLELVVAMPDVAYDPKSPAWGQFKVVDHVHLNPGASAPGIHRVLFEVPAGYPTIAYDTICAWSRARSQNREFELAGVESQQASVAYWPGSILNVQPVLADEVVDALLDVMECDGALGVEVGGQSLTLRDALATRFDNSGPIKPGILKALAKLAPESKLVTQLSGAARAEKQLFGTTLDVLEAVKAESGVVAPLESVLAACKRKIVCRRYTIASHSRRHDFLELVVVESSTEMPSGRIDLGICSAMLSSCRVGDVFDAQVMVKPDYPPVSSDCETLFLFGRGSGYSGLPHFAWDLIEAGSPASIVLATGGTTIRELANLEELEALGEAGVLVVAALREPESADEYRRNNPGTKINFVGKPVGETMAVPGVTEAFLAAMRSGEARICGGPGPTGALTDWLVENDHVELYPEAQAMYDKFQPIGPHKGDKAKALRRHCMKAMELDGEYKGKIFVDVF